MFGSFGWRGEGAENVGGMLEQMKVELVDAPLVVNFAADGQDLQRCYQLGAKVADRLRQTHPAPV